jgi:hypothetical protein
MYTATTDHRLRTLAEKLVLGASIVISLVGLLVLNWLFFEGKR